MEEHRDENTAGALLFITALGCDLLQNAEKGEENGRQDHVARSCSNTCSEAGRHFKALRRLQ